MTNKMAVYDKLYQYMACGLLSTNLDTFIHAVLLQIVTVSLKIDEPVRSRKNIENVRYRATDILHTRYGLDVLTFIT